MRLSVCTAAFLLLVVVESRASVMKKASVDVDEEDDDEEDDDESLLMLSSCASCLAAKGAWCVGAQTCVPDVRGNCKHPNDHIGSVGRFKTCNEESKASEASIRAGKIQEPTRQRRATLPESKVAKEKQDSPSNFRKKEHWFVEAENVLASRQARQDANKDDRGKKKAKPDGSQVDSDESVRIEQSDNQCHAYQRAHQLYKDKKYKESYLHLVKSTNLASINSVAAMKKQSPHMLAELHYLVSEISTNSTDFHTRSEFCMFCVQHWLN